MEHSVTSSSGGKTKGYLHPQVNTSFNTILNGSIQAIDEVIEWLEKNRIPFSRLLDNESIVLNLFPDIDKRLQELINNKNFNVYS
jgi:hypothetical protein